MLITEEGEVVPRGEVERMAAEREADATAEAEVVDAEPGLGAMAPDLVEDEQEEACVRVRRAPKEPTHEERMRHEATHLPYRSWCPHLCARQGAECPAQAVH